MKKIGINNSELVIIRRNALHRAIEELVEDGTLTEDIFRIDYVTRVMKIKGTLATLPVLINFRPMREKQKIKTAIRQVLKKRDLEQTPKML